eukprot:s3535_g3.t1
MGVAGAGRGTKTNGSQFFIAMRRLPFLDGKHTFFGKVVGQTIYNLVRLNEVEVDKKDIPVAATRIAERYKQSVPKQIKEKEEHRRAPVRKKNALSFAGAGSDEEEDDEEAEGNVKVKSAHDVLNDPRLSRDVAYPEEAIGSVLHPVLLDQSLQPRSRAGGREQEDAARRWVEKGKRPAAPQEGDAKRHRVAEPTVVFIKTCLEPEHFHVDVVVFSVPFIILHP